MKYILIALFVITSVTGFSQSEQNFNKFSVEIGGGLQGPFAPRQGVNLTDYVAFRQFEVAGRYMFDRTYGLKAHYAFNGWRNPDFRSQTYTFHRVGIEGVANITNLLGVDYPLRGNFSLLLHGGGGITFARPYTVSGTDHMGNLMIGLTPQVKLSERVSLFGDFTTVFNFRQHYQYDGKVYQIPYEKGTTGSFWDVSIGIMVNIGKEAVHADWF